jgi:hypothetical protein
VREPAARLVAAAAAPVAHRARVVPDLGGAVEQAHELRVPVQLGGEEGVCFHAATLPPGRARGVGVLP